MSEHLQAHTKWSGKWLWYITCSSCSRINSHMRSIVQKQVSRVGTSNYIPQYLWDVITCLYHWYLILAQRSSYSTDRIFCKIVSDILNQKSSQELSGDFSVYLIPLLLNVYVTTISVPWISGWTRYFVFNLSCIYAIHTHKSECLSSGNKTPSTPKTRAPLYHACGQLMAIVPTITWYMFSENRFTSLSHLSL